MNDIEFIEVGPRKIVIRGIGKMFYQDGFPISMAVQRLSDSGYEVSILHVADECLKNGWSAETIVKKFREDFADIGEHADMKVLTEFVNATYEHQREMLYQYIFDSDQGKAKAFIDTIYIE